MNFEVEVDDDGFKRSLERHAERVLRPAMAEVVVFRPAKVALSHF